MCFSDYEVPGVAPRTDVIGQMLLCNPSLGILMGGIWLGALGMIM